MNSYVTGTIIKEFRERENITQAQLADRLMVSSKTISKWENGRGLPDISLLDPLAKALNVSLIELMAGYTVKNNNYAANMKKGVWYVCPVCGNVIHAMGDSVVSCCGITLPKIEVEEPDDKHVIKVERIDDEYYVSMDHPMDKSHYICFFTYSSENKLQVVKLFPESEAACSFKIVGHGRIYAYCNHHGMFVTEV